MRWNAKSIVLTSNRTMARNQMISGLCDLSKEDQYDNLAIHTNKGIEFLDKYANFIRDRLAIETEYAAKL
ncbi:hypothetical protein DOY81_003397, partial [Sarcophaga bullata]